MKPEYIEEPEYNPESEIKHKAACVWKLLGNYYTKEQLQQYCALYGISTTQALRWKYYWINPPW